MLRCLRSGLLSPSIASMMILGVFLLRGVRHPEPSPQSLDDWDIPTLTTHLHRAGVEVRLVSTQKNGLLGETSFLTFTDKKWEALNDLSKDSQRIQDWRGTVYCERVRGKTPAALDRLWDDHCLVVGPFVFYGDAELLDRIRVALAASTDAFRGTDPRHPVQPRK